MNIEMETLVKDTGDICESLIYIHINPDEVNH